MNRLNILRAIGMTAFLAFANGAQAFCGTWDPLAAPVPSPGGSLEIGQSLNEPDALAPGSISKPMALLDCGLTFPKFSNLEVNKVTNILERVEVTAQSTRLDGWVTICRNGVAQMSCSACRMLRCDSSKLGCLSLWGSC